MTAAVLPAALHTNQYHHLVVDQARVPTHSPYIHTATSSPVQQDSDYLQGINHHSQYNHHKMPHSTPRTPAPSVQHDLDHLQGRQEDNQVIHHQISHSTPHTQIPPTPPSSGGQDYVIKVRQFNSIQLFIFDKKTL